MPHPLQPTSDARQPFPSQKSCGQPVSLLIPYECEEIEMGVTPGGLGEALPSLSLFGWSHWSTKTCKAVLKKKQTLRSNRSCK